MNTMSNNVVYYNRYTQIKHKRCRETWSHVQGGTFCPPNIK